MNNPSPPVVRQSSGLTYLYMSAAFVVVVAGMRAAESIINPLLLAIFLTIISAPAYFGLLKKGVSTWLALLIVTGVLGGITLVLVYVLTNSIASFLDNQDHYRDRLREERAQVMASVKQWLPEEKEKQPPEENSATDTTTGEAPAASSDPETSQPAADDEAPSTDTTNTPAAADNASQPDAAVDEDADTSLDEAIVSTDTADIAPKRGPPRALSFPERSQPLPESKSSWEEYMSEQFDPGTIISLAASIAGSLGQLLSNALLILLTVIFILLEAGTFAKKINKAFIRTDEAMERANTIVSSVQNYIVIKTWVSLLTGILIWLWLSLFGVSHAPLWGLLSFLFNFIPNIGSFIAAVPAVLIAWLELDVAPAIGAAIGFVLVNGILGNFVEPRLMGKGLGLSPVVVFASMIFWGWVLGPVGMLLSVPLTMTARIVMDGFDDTKWIATLMGTGE